MWWEPLALFVIFCYDPELREETETFAYLARPEDGIYLDDEDRFISTKTGRLYIPDPECDKVYLRHELNEEEIKRHRVFVE